MQRFLNQLIPFILIGIAIVAFALGIMLLAYLFLIGAIVGFVLFIAARIREKFFQPKKAIKRKDNKPGRIIDSDDWKEL
jgi:hypothetical protein